MHNNNNNKCAYLNLKFGKENRLSAGLFFFLDGAAGGILSFFFSFEGFLFFLNFFFSDLKLYYKGIICI